VGGYAACAISLSCGHLIDPTWRAGISDSRPLRQARGRLFAKNAKERGTQSAGQPRAGVPFKASFALSGRVRDLRWEIRRQDASRRQIARAALEAALNSAWSFEQVRTYYYSFVLISFNIKKERDPQRNLGVAQMKQLEEEKTRYTFDSS